MGNVFTKSDIREAFPDTAQADRRIRDLRDFGWVLHARSEDASLLQEQTRFVRAGVEVWDPRARRAADPQKAISAKVRDDVMARDSYMCTTCGITGGEEYPDAVMQSGVLSVTKQTVRLPDGSEREELVTRCKRCRAGRGARSVSVAEAMADAAGLGNDDLRELIGWIGGGRRRPLPIERAWSSYLGLPPDARADVRARLVERSLEE
ncbi:hypothetical protein ACIA49_34330 [Kribbella sp. NPDC051587]|uniref:hypothetical protein n=1 Tax=Kribbella sp. NPDC051587 TaxID=3364119 RepID=UPI00378880DD